MKYEESLRDKNCKNKEKDLIHKHKMYINDWLKEANWREQQKLYVVQGAVQTLAKCNCQPLYVYQWKPLMAAEDRVSPTSEFMPAPELHCTVHVFCA